ncbi:hypothetical protein HDU90_001611 [Geranomyces variabilis]|nr:hypothetical protein HDU90_001611 [Geranomyces variabilis]
MGNGVGGSRQCRDEADNRKKIVTDQAGLSTLLRDMHHRLAPQILETNADRDKILQRLHISGMFLQNWTASHVLVGYVGGYYAAKTIASGQLPTTLDNRFKHPADISAVPHQRTNEDEDGAIDSELSAIDLAKETPSANEVRAPGDHAHQGPTDAVPRTVSFSAAQMFFLADEDERQDAETLLKVAAEPLRATGPETLRCGSKRQAQYKEVVFLPATSLVKAVTFYEKQRKHFACHGYILRDTIKVLETQAEGHACEIQHFEDYEQLAEKIFTAHGDELPTQIILEWFCRFDGNYTNKNA